MAIVSILQYPHPLLKSASRPIQTIDRFSARIIRDLLDTLEASPGVALAAPQIGQPFRIIVSEVLRKGKEGHHGRIILINPVIKHREGKKAFREGCLSVPHFTGNVYRSRQIHVEGLNEKGRRVQIITQGFEALALQHEIDHLNGLLFLDRIASLRNDLFLRKVY